METHLVFLQLFTHYNLITALIKFTGKFTLFNKNCQKITEKWKKKIYVQKSQKSEKN